MDLYQVSEFNKITNLNHSVDSATAKQPSIVKLFLNTIICIRKD